jgi:hypothetical protein
VIRFGYGADATINPASRQIKQPKLSRPTFNKGLGLRITPPAILHEHDCSKCESDLHESWQRSETRALGGCCCGCGAVRCLACDLASSQLLVLARKEV